MGKIHELRENKKVHAILIGVYVLLLLVFIINFANFEVPLNYNYFLINTPTDYKLIQTYPPSVNEALNTGDLGQMLFIQVHLHANTIIRENTPLTIESKAWVGASYAKNVSSIDVGFFGAHYTDSKSHYLYYKGNSSERWEIWTGFAGATLNSTTDEHSTILYSTNGTTYYGDNSEICWKESGDKALSFCLNWTVHTPTDYYFVYTYDNSVVHVYANNDLRADAMAFAGAIGILGGLLFGIFEVIPSIQGEKQIVIQFPLSITEPRKKPKNQSPENQNRDNKEHPTDSQTTSYDSK